MLAPERRRRSDLVAAAAILAVAVLVLGVIWFRSDARGTTSETANSPLPEAASASSVPASLAERWRTTSPVTSTPVATGSAAVAGDGGTVTGIDPTDGTVAWRYARDLTLCAVTGAWNTAVSVYRDDRGCSQATVLNAADGARKAQRSSLADNDIRLSEDGTYVTARGDTRLEMWRSDMVRTLEYGRVDAPVNPHEQPRTGCTLLSSASNSSRLAVLEKCPDEAAVRLTTLNPAPKDAREPEEYGSSVVAALIGADQPVDGVQILVASGDRIAVVLPSQSGAPARIALFDGNAQPITDFDLPADLSDQLTGGMPFPVVKAANVFSWWTGTGVVALGLSDLAPRWLLPDALGPGTLMAGRLLVPVPDGTAVIDPDTGTAERVLAVDRDGYTGPVGTAVIGDVVLEQRGEALIGLSGPT